MHCCTTTSTSTSTLTLTTSTAIRPRGNAAHFLTIPGSGALLGPRPVWLDFWGRGGPRGETRRIEEGPPENRGDKPKKIEDQLHKKGRNEGNEEKRGGPAGPDPSPPRGPPGPPFNPPRGSRWLPGHTRPFCFIFGAFLLVWWKFFVFKKSACSICAAGLWNGHPALSAHRNTKVTKASSEVAQAGPSSLQHKAKQGGHNKSKRFHGLR